MASFLRRVLRFILLLSLHATTYVLHIIPGVSYCKKNLLVRLLLYVYILYIARTGKAQTTDSIPHDAACLGDRHSGGIAIGAGDRCAPSRRINGKSEHARAAAGLDIPPIYRRGATHTHMDYTHTNGYWRVDSFLYINNSDSLHVLCACRHSGGVANRAGDRCAPRRRSNGRSEHARAAGLDLPSIYR